MTKRFGFFALVEDAGRDVVFGSGWRSGTRAGALEVVMSFSTPFSKRAREPSRKRIAVNLTTIRGGAVNRSRGQGASAFLLRQIE